MFINACTNCGKRKTFWPSLFVTAELSKIAVVRCTPIVRVTSEASRTKASQGSTAKVPSGLLFFEYCEKMSCKFSI